MQGLREEFVCHGREEVIETFRWALAERRDVDALEFIRGGDRVVVGVRGPAITEAAGEPLEGQIFNVFTFRDGRIVRIDDYRRRSEALAVAGGVVAVREVGCRVGSWSTTGLRDLRPSAPSRSTTIASAPALPSTSS